MSLNPQDKQVSKLIPIPNTGTVPARLARVIEIGTHSTLWGDKDQVILYYTLPTRIIDEEDSNFHGMQHMIRTAPLRKSSSDKATLMEHVNVLNPSATGLDQLIDKPCFLTIVHNKVESGDTETTFANILKNSVSGVPEGIEVGAADTTGFYFDYQNPDEDIWTDKLWDKVREQIKSALNYQGSAVEEMVLRLEAMKSE